MSCAEHVVDAAKDPERCKCQGAVLRAFEALKKDQVPDEIALEAARRVYSFHHPEDDLPCARLTVERWVHEGQFQ